MLVYWNQVKKFIFIGLSKERPILDHHPKAHIHEIRRISKDQLPGMVSPMFKLVLPLNTMYNCVVIGNHICSFSNQL